MGTCDRCGAAVEERDAFRYDDKIACRKHLLEFDSIGSLAFARSGVTEYLYSATRSEIERIAKDRDISDVVVRSFQWTSLPRKVSRPLRVSDAYRRTAAWVTLEKNEDGEDGHRERDER